MRASGSVFALRRLSAHACFRPGKSGRRHSCPGSTRLFCLKKLPARTSSMSTVLLLRAAVKERLSAAVEEVCALVERSIAEYEEELRRSIQNQRNIAEYEGEEVRGWDQEEEQQQQQEEEEQRRREERLEALLWPAGGAAGGAAGAAGGVQTDSLCPEMKEEPEEQPLPQILTVSTKREPQDDDEDWEPAARGSRKSAERKLSGAGPSGASVPERKYKCSSCDKRFTRKQNMDKHSRVHTGERPFSCPVCHKAFSHKYNVTSHMMTHTGERPFSCSLCDKAFSKKVNLDAHIKIHRGEKPYSCSVCEKTFSKSGNLRCHLRVHQAENLRRLYVEEHMRKQSQ